MSAGGSNNGDALGPLTRLHYFDGKLLRARDLELEQSYLRSLVALSNQAGGAGVVHGYDARLVSGDRLSLGPGLAIDTRGRLLLSSQVQVLSIPMLIQASQQLASGAGAASAGGALAAGAFFGDCQPLTEPAPAGGVALPSPLDLFVVCLAHAEDLCGHEDIYGALCEPACTQGTERPYVVEGIVVRLVPLNLALAALPTVAAVAVGAAHLRSRVASAFFAREAAEIATLINGPGLRSGIFCLGAQLGSAACVPVAVVGRSGATTTFLDPWIARRERMEAPARRYWARRFSMRPWDVFLAEVLQFQCQLPGVLAGGGEDGGEPTDPCAPKTAVIGQAATAVQEVRSYLAKLAETLKDVPLSPEARLGLQLDRVDGWVKGHEVLEAKLREAERSTGVATTDVLLRGGIVELPPAGYLPVLPSATATVNRQVADLLGPGVDLRFCVVRPDYVAHALEEAQHLARISLFEGLADPAKKPKLDILVPDGELVTAPANTAGKAFDAALAVISSERQRFVARGAARADLLPAGGAAFYFAGVGATPSSTPPPPAPAPAPAPAPQPSIQLMRDAALKPQGADVPATPNFTIAVQAPPAIEEVALQARKFVITREADRKVEPEQVIAHRIDGLPAKVVDNKLSSQVWATWLNMRCDLNPLALAEGAATPASLRLVGVVPVAKPELEEFSVSGELRVVDRAAVPGTIRVQGILTGSATQRVTTSKNQLDSHTGAVHTPFILVQRGDASAGELLLTFPLDIKKRALRMVARAKWSGNPTEAEATLQIFDGKATSSLDFVPSDTLSSSQPSISLLRALAINTNVTSLSSGPAATGELGRIAMEVKEDPAVLQPGDQRHLWAQQALVVLDAVLDEPGFRAAAERLLFPPARLATPETAVRARLPWVLFHRRRESSCDCCQAEKAAPPKTRRYHLYVAELDSTAEIARLRVALLKNDAAALGRTKLIPFSYAAIDGASAEVLTSAGALVADLRGAPHGRQLIYSAVASTPEVEKEGDALAAARLKGVEDRLLAELTPAPARIPSDVLGDIPSPPLSSANADGVMVFVTVPVATPAPAHVARMIINSTATKSRVTNLPDGSPLPDLRIDLKDPIAVSSVVVETLNKLGMPTADTLDMATPGTPDAQSGTRLNAAVAALAKVILTFGGQQVPLVGNNTIRSVRAASAAEQPFFKEQSVEVNELLVFTVKRLAPG